MAFLATPRHALASIATLLVLGITWWMLAPAALGGGTAVVVTTGTSMEPAMHEGDLAVVRAVDPASIRVGHVVLYRSTSLRRDVLHRVRSISPSGRLSLSGDNNDFMDRDRPHRTEVTGRVLFSLPGAGKLPFMTSRPLALAAVALLLFGAGWLLFSPAARRADGDDAVCDPDTRDAAGRPALPIAGIALVSLVVASGTWWWAGTLPTGGTEPSARASDAAPAMRHTGRFSYSGVEPNRAIQPDNEVSTGDAVFTRTVDSIDLRFAYALEGPDASDANGSATMRMQLEDDNGWSTTTRLDRATVRGGRASLTATVDLRELRARIRAFERATGTSGPLYRIRVRPSIELGDDAPGAAAGASFGPELVLVMDALRVRPELLTGGDAQSQYRPSASIGSSASAEDAAPTAKPRLTRTVGRALAFLILTLGAVAGGLLLSRPSRPVEEAAAAEPEIDDEVEPARMPARTAPTAGPMRAPQPRPATPLVTPRLVEAAPPAPVAAAPAREVPPVATTALGAGHRTTSGESAVAELLAGSGVFSLPALDPPTAEPERISALAAPRLVDLALRSTRPVLVTTSADGLTLGWYVLGPEGWVELREDLRDQDAAFEAAA